MIGQAERLYELNSLIKGKERKNSNTRILTFSSGKGGTGKSFIAGNIGYQLSLLGLKVLLVDIDINFSNLNVLFNIKSKTNIYHYLTYNKSIDEVIYKYSENMDIIFGESGKIDHPEFTKEKADGLIKDLKNSEFKYDYIIFDTPSGIDNGSIQLLLRSDEVIIVTTPEPTSVMDSYVILKMMKNNGSGCSNNVIVNKTFNSKEGIETFNNLDLALKHFLKINIKYLGEISFSEEIIKSIQNQTLLLSVTKSSKIAHQFQSICDTLRIPAIG